MSASILFRAGAQPPGAIGATISFESEFGNGSVFMVELR